MSTGPASFQTWMVWVSMCTNFGAMGIGGVPPNPLAGDRRAKGAALLSRNASRDVKDLICNRTLLGNFLNFGRSRLTIGRVCSQLLQTR